MVVKKFQKVDVEDQPDIQLAMNRVHVSLDEIRGILHHGRSTITRICDAVENATGDVY